MVSRNKLIFLMGEFNTIISVIYNNQNNPDVISEYKIRLAELSKVLRILDKYEDVLENWKQTSEKYPEEFRDNVPGWCW